jgi:hypothetical protein
MLIGFYNGLTNEQIVREATPEEITERESEELTWEQEQNQQLAVEAEKAELEASAVSKLEALGLTAEEIAALKR